MQPISNGLFLFFSPDFSANLEEEKERKCNFKFYI
jgi:hypothetical protein